jgi:guanylate kinase
MTVPSASAIHHRMPRRGVLLVISSPSGAGKGTLSRALTTNHPDIFLSISVTTRGQRPSEVDDVHYHFIDKRRFEAMRDDGELLEWAEVHGNYYGTPAAPVEQALASGRDVLFDIDWQGAAQVRERMPDDTVSVFILPPTMAELRNRLQRRAEDPEDVIERRLRNARTEIAQWPNFDYVVVNDVLQGAYEDIETILHAERLRRARAEGGIAEFVGQLLA